TSDTTFTGVTSQSGGRARMPAQRTPRREALAGAGTTASLLAATVGGALVVAGLLGAGAFPGGPSKESGTPLHLAPAPARARTAAAGEGGAGIVLPRVRAPRAKAPAHRVHRPAAASPAPARPAPKRTPTPAPAKAPPAHSAHPSSSQSPPPPAATAPPQPPVAA